MSSFNDDYAVSEEQERDFNLLVRLSKEINDAVSSNREKVITILLAEDLTGEEKKKTLKEFSRSRVFFSEQRAIIDGIAYNYDEPCRLAKKLFDDPYFIGGESATVMDGLAFYENGLSFEDIIIAFHNYRLGHSEEDLWWLGLLLSRYIYFALHIDSVYDETPDYGIEDTYAEIMKIAEYVISFWEKYLKGSEMKARRLADDNIYSFSEKMEYDASFYFNSMDAENEEDRIRAYGPHAADLTSRCAKTLYILYSTMKEIDSDDFSRVVRRMRSFILDLCDSLYIDEDDPFGELEKDKRLNSEKLQNIEKDYEILLLQTTLHSAIEGLSEYDTGTILGNRLGELQHIALLNSAQLIEEFSVEFSKLLRNSIQEDLTSYYVRINHELGEKCKLVSDEALKTLASAEYLYDNFVKKKAPEGFDYSGIAVLYFQAFETLYDTLVVEPYSLWLHKQGVDSLYVEKANLQEIKNEKRTTEQRERIKAINKELAEYFPASFDERLFFHKGKLVTYLEIGKFQRFINLGESKKTCRLFEYLEKECFKKDISIQEIIHFSQSVQKATDPRNKASHGLQRLREKDVREDKIIVYDESNLDSVKEYKNLLYEFLSFFNCTNTEVER